MITVATITALARYGWQISDRPLGRGARIVTASHPRYESGISAVYNERERSAKWVEVDNDGPATRHDTLRAAVAQVYRNQHHKNQPVVSHEILADLCGAEA